MTPSLSILATLRANLADVLAYLAASPNYNRTRLAAGLCGILGMLDSRGRPRLSGCLLALRTLEGEGLLRLPAPQRTPGSVRTRRRTPEPVADPHAVPSEVDGVAGLRLLRVDDEASLRIWNDILVREHPFGHRPLVGRQIRYLIQSEHGVLGALGFASAALSLRERDAWIGWTPGQRQVHQNQLMGLARLLIRPMVRCANLASKALGLAAARIGADAEELFGEAPWLLESFTEPEHGEGSSFKAAGWVRVGQTQGRGRQDRAHRKTESVKTVWMKELRPDWREAMGIGLEPKHPPLPIEQGLGTRGWAGAEFGQAELGDRRLGLRLVTLAQAKGDHPGSSILQALEGDRAALAGYYRFLDQPAHSAVDMEHILAPHRERTLGRMAGQRRVLCIHDSTDLNFGTLHRCQGLGVIGSNQTTTQTAGLRLHTSYVVGAGEGLPLGLLAWNCHPRARTPERKGKDRRGMPTEEKETYRWVQSFQECLRQSRELPGVEVRHVMDAEADFFALFDHWRTQGGGQHLLVRAKADRRTRTEGESLFAAVRASEVLGTCVVNVPRKSARGKPGTAQASPARPKRTANLELRWQRTQLLPPGHGLLRNRPPVEVWILHAREVGAEAGVAPLEWILLSTSPIETLDEATQALSDYAKRWRIEDWHRILKTCCGAEDPAVDTAEGLRRVLAINMVIAWRIHLLTLLGREAPHLPMEVVFSDVEIHVLVLLARRCGWKRPGNLGEAMEVVARYGGYQARKHDPPPGAQVLWRGLIQLMFASTGAELVMKDATRPADKCE